VIGAAFGGGGIRRRKGGIEVTLKQRLIKRLRQFRSEVDGQGLAEYALILALIAIVAIIALVFLGSQVSDKLSVIGSTIHSVAG
jgi:pilus assembly protein Flp/PilA